MEETNYGLRKRVTYNFDKAIEKVTEALKNQGFGILTKIDVKAKMKEKLNKDTENYMILGVCNPSAAYQVLQEEMEAGLLLPCNVIVYNKDGHTHVAAIRPSRAMKVIDAPTLHETALKVEEELKTALQSI